MQALAEDYSMVKHKKSSRMLDRFLHSFPLICSFQPDRSYNCCKSNHNYYHSIDTDIVL